jgi:hypothetical protein
MAEEISPAWKKQYKKEIQYDKDFEHAEGKTGKSLKGGIDNPKNWRGGKWEMTHDPYSNRKKITAQEGSKKTSKPTTKKSTKKITTKR